MMGTNNDGTNTLVIRKIHHTHTHMPTKSNDYSAIQYQNNWEDSEKFQESSIRETVKLSADPKDLLFKLSQG